MLRYSLLSAKNITAVRFNGEMSRWRSFFDLIVVDEEENQTAAGWR